MVNFRTLSTFLIPKKLQFKSSTCAEMKLCAVLSRMLHESFTSTEMNGCFWAKILKLNFLRQFFHLQEILFLYKLLFYLNSDFPLTDANSFHRFFLFLSSKFTHILSTFEFCFNPIAFYFQSWFKHL